MDMVVFIQALSDIHSYTISKTTGCHRSKHLTKPFLAPLKPADCWFHNSLSFYDSFFVPRNLSLSHLRSCRFQKIECRSRHDSVAIKMRYLYFSRLFD
jgi:hypothetical protein